MFFLTFYMEISQERGFCASHGVNLTGRGTLTDAVFQLECFVVVLVGKQQGLVHSAPTSPQCCYCADVEDEGIRVGVWGFILWLSLQTRTKTSFFLPSASVWHLTFFGTNYGWVE